MAHAGGRPTEYKSNYNEQAYKLALLGATDAEIADFFDVSEQTINSWKQKFPEFLESMRDGKTKADFAVAHKLYDKALGAEWKEEQAFKVKKVFYVDGKKHEQEEIVTVPVKRVAPPDTQAISLWLRNRKADKWRDKIDHEHGGNVQVEIVRFSDTKDTASGQ